MSTNSGVRSDYLIGCAEIDSAKNFFEMGLHMTFITSLISGPDKYSGSGVNHEGEVFLGTLVVQRLLNDKGVMLHYEATVGGHQVHAESTLLAPDMDGNIVLWPVMSELPGVLPHRAVVLTESEGVFASGSREDRSSFREEITIRLEADGTLTYAHAWGMPDGDFADRSSSRLAPDLQGDGK